MRFCGQIKKWIWMFALLVFVSPMTVYANEYIQINKANFPDDSFREYVKTEVDRDNDGKLKKIYYSQWSNAQKINTKP